MQLTCASWGEPRTLDVAANDFSCNPPKSLQLLIEGGSGGKKLRAAHMQYPIGMRNYLTYIHIF